MQFQTQIAIAAPAETVWDILIDAPGYASWNTTVERVEGRVAAGETVTVHAKIAPGRAFPVKVVTFEPPSRLVWSGGMPLGLFTGARTFTIRPLAGDMVEFAMTETYTGLMAPLITKSIPDLQPAFDEFAACLKARAERGA